MFGTKSVIALATAAVLSAINLTGAQAGPRDHGYGHGRDGRGAVVNGRIRNQSKRIHRGRRKGRLNWAETRRLRFELSHIRGFRVRYLRDGRLNGSEWRHMRRLLNQNSRRIRRMASNGWRGHRNWRNRRGDYRRMSRFNGF
jgi:hypothetical protein